jgi:2-polyprenyl-3-methyl-5-hydroxy-6-metoxy-1,4-benzoquinol methylase
MEEYIKHNKDSWNERVPVHLRSEFYRVEQFKTGESSLHSIELDLLGEIQGKKVLHLQCHFGQDTLSLARMGADVTGIDFSDVAIDTARELAEELAIPSRFICSDVYALDQHLKDKYDLIFTSYGVIGWLPDMNKWAQMISHFLKPGGRFILVEFHPVVWMMDNDFTKIEYSYFNTDPIIEENTGTYTDRNADIESTTISWNHSLDEVLGALLSNGLQIDSFREFDYSPFDCFRGTEEFSPGKYRIASLGNKIPMVYALACTKL